MMQLCLITPQALFNSLCNSEPPPNTSHHSTRQVPFLSDRSSCMHPSLYFASFLSYTHRASLKIFSRPLSQISMSGYGGWNRGSLTDSSVGVVVSVPAPSLEQGCLPEESAHGNTNSPNNDASSTLPEFIDAIDSVRDHESILY